MSKRGWVCLVGLALLVVSCPNVKTTQKYKTTHIMLNNKSVTVAYDNFKTFKIDGYTVNSSGRYLSNLPYYKPVFVKNSKGNLLIKYKNEKINKFNAGVDLVYSEEYSVGKKTLNLVKFSYDTINTPESYKYIKEELSRKKSIQEIIKEVSNKYSIPEIILKRVAYCESEGKQYVKNNSGNVVPNISFDGGCGLMQVQVEECDTKDEFVSAIWNTGKNIEYGAKVLTEKWDYMQKGVIPKEDLMAKNCLESWYLPLWAYNGYCYLNNPNGLPYSTSYGLRRYAYQEKVLGGAASLVSHTNLPSSGVAKGKVIIGKPLHWVKLGNLHIGTPPKITGYHWVGSRVYWEVKEYDYGDKIARGVLYFKGKTYKFNSSEYLDINGVKKGDNLYVYLYDTFGNKSNRLKIQK